MLVQKRITYFLNAPLYFTLKHIGIDSATNCEIRPYISRFGPKSDLILRENQTKIGPKIR